MFGSAQVEVFRIELLAETNPLDWKKNVLSFSAPQ
jgi:hypothetical protein